MSMIPEVKCRRCGESFSALRSRCPNCGTRRVSQSSRTPDTTPGTVKGTAAYERVSANTKWQMIFGLILVVAVILAVIVMVSTGVNGNDSPTGSSIIAGRPNDVPESVPPTAEAVPTPPPTPTPAPQKVEIRYTIDARERTDVTMAIGEILPLEAVILPTDISGTVTWKLTHPTENAEDYVKLTVNSDNPNRINLECLAFLNGGVKLTAEVYGVTAECMIYMKTG